MTTLFIADLHLSENEPAITAGFLAFLQREAIHADALYILGDLFEFWIGDDEPNTLHTQVAQALSELHDKGVPCYFIHGNRDFLIGKRFAKQSKMTLLPEELVIDVYGEKILILHGDTLCTDDPGYLRFRKYIRNPLIQKIFLSLPLFLRLKIANKLRRQSKLSNRTKSSVMMDVNQLAVIKKLQDHNVIYMVHGHTHRPAIHDLTMDGQVSKRAVLGAWHDTGSVFKIDADNNIELISFPLQED
ncbi:UDP-2,3-diacylglucosamine diphosphatase [Pragia fontium]|uniref:UDP-2,3-diacylglucosamine hydrolase n=1 Tax=Pragia fontium TaxID=82985 RepID=A0ABQ5LFP0_9GAMM|nr:UDP-2,3-diacylglucosamine diphosphatase [Pragia fontium]AKJ41747.1 UDP-2,3-diacylglucosamine hydrolase [Pragia fontium]GKX62164.1 UDP-2,3-diacylglucosamine hydrolase [Pragia fontium]SUB81980.1 UDP-2,3-diacylglucosamine hydrolase [Pragia fontium]VEJ54569.1 UDP-2,3-diacylglucosamine hydrolase [Pragia fontium]